MTSRRDVLGTLLAGVAGLPMASAIAQRPAGRRLDVLVLGGTGFIGPHQVERLLARGHRVTMFNRGRSAAGLFGNRVEALVGDRDARVGAGLAALAGRRRWDAVIDNSGYVPRHVRDSATLLHGRVGRYLYVSTISAYGLEQGGVFGESSPLKVPADPAAEAVTGETYGPLKAECDRIVRDVFASAATVVRPTYVVGPGDDTDRFTYWVDRTAKGGEILSPPNAGDVLQWIDVRDLAAWMVDLLERDVSGVFNAASRPMAWGEILVTLARAARQSVRLRGATVELLERFGIELPLVDPSGTQWAIATSAAESAGLVSRPLVETGRDTLSWWLGQAAERRENPAGWPTPEIEREALARLRRV